MSSTIASNSSPEMVRIKIDYREIKSIRKGILIFVGISIIRPD